MKKIVVIVSIVFFSIRMCATDGLIDSSFGVGGRVTATFESAGNLAVIQQPDGKIVTVGGVIALGDTDFALVRYNADGSLDSSFGTGGLVTTSFGGTDDRAMAVVLQPDGKVVVVGRVLSGTLDVFHFALARYNADGSLDTSFGTNGQVTTSVGGTNDQGLSAVLQENGRIIVAGTSNLSGTFDFSLARYLSPSISISQLARDLRAKYFLLQ